jgi:UDP-N-acetylmuramate--alanine ligase
MRPITAKAHVHFIGIGGSGLSAIARMLKESGYVVTGSDRSPSAFSADLQAAGVQIHIGHDAANIRGADWVVRSSAVPDENVEVQAARDAGIPVYRRADFLGEFMAKKTGIAVAGTHGKTTTTAMISFALAQMNQDPTFIVGGVLNNLGVNARAGSGDLFVVEADEYDHMFLGLKPKIEVVTSVEHDHPDCYPTFEAMYSAFQAFMGLLPPDGYLVGSADNPGSASLMQEARAQQREVMAYSTLKELRREAERWMQATNIRPNEHGGFEFKAIAGEKSHASTFVSLQVPGIHNVANALAALCVMSLLGLPLADGAQALSEFRGTGRRFEVLGERRGVIVIDDYAHHPTEIRATLAAARARYPGRRIWAVWQPHTYSRTRALFTDFSRAFADADRVVVTEIYAAREPVQDFSSEQVVRAMPGGAAYFAPSLDGATQYLLAHLESNDVVLVLSAGDADQISRQVLAGLGE